MSLAILDPITRVRSISSILFCNLEFKFLYGSFLFVYSRIIYFQNPFTLCLQIWRISLPSSSCQNIVYSAFITWNPQIHQIWKQKNHWSNNSWINSISSANSVKTIPSGPWSPKPWHQPMVVQDRDGGGGEGQARVWVCCWTSPLVSGQQEESCHPGQRGQGGQEQAGGQLHLQGQAPGRGGGAGGGSGGPCWQLPGRQLREPGGEFSSRQEWWELPVPSTSFSGEILFNAHKIIFWDKKNSSISFQ